VIVLLVYLHCVPAVGPLAELLNVTQLCCKELNRLASTGSISPADVSQALDSKGVRTLATLVKWLQATPQDQLLLATESSETLWQLLLVTLANLLRAAEHDQAITAQFCDALLASGGLLVPCSEPAGKRMDGGGGGCIIC
jgi:hypothetical protein